MRYAAARFEQYQKAEAYRIFCSDALKCIAENTRNFAGGSAPSMRLYDVLCGKSQPKAEEKAPEEIVESVIKSGGLTMLGGDE